MYMYTMVWSVWYPMLWYGTLCYGMAYTFILSYLLMLRENFGNLKRCIGG